MECLICLASTITLCSKFDNSYCFEMRKLANVHTDLPNILCIYEFNRIFMNMCSTDITMYISLISMYSGTTYQYLHTPPPNF